jgi:tetratricopeptide (TPR) repeat protein
MEGYAIGCTDDQRKARCRKQQEPTVSQFKPFWMILTALAFLPASEVNAQIMFDLIAPVQEDIIKELRQQPRPTAPRPSQNSGASANKLYDQGLQLLRQENYQSSLAVYDRVITLNPSWASAYVNRDLARSGLKELQGALEDINYAIRLDSKLAGAYRARAYVLYKLRDYQTALEDLNQAMRLEPIAMGYHLRSAVSFALGNYQEALEDAKRALRLNPKLALAYAVQGGAYLALGEEQSALVNANQAVTLAQAGSPKSDLVGTYVNRSVVHYGLGNWEKAINDSRTAILLKPESAEAMLSLATILYARGDRQESLQLAEKAIRLDQNLADLKYLKETGWVGRLLTDAQTFFNSPQMKGILSAANTGSATQEIFGVGLQLKQEPNTKQLIVSNTITGGSAAAAGMLPMDVITRIDNLSIYNPFRIAVRGDQIVIGEINHEQTPAFGHYIGSFFTIGCHGQQCTT